jgi:hypothetical protein
MTRFKTRFVSLLVVTAALLSSLAVVSAAYGADIPGSNIPNATSLNTYLGSSLTTFTMSSGINPNGYYYMRVELSKGNSFSATFTPSPALIGQKAIVLARTSSYRDVVSSLDASGVAHLTFMAPATGMYNVYLGTQALPGTFTVTPAKVSATKFSLGSMSVPSAKHGKSFTVAMTMKPRYNGPTSPVKFYIQRKVNGHYKSYTYHTASFYTKTTYSKFTKKFTLPKGTFRVHARFADAAHTSPKYNSYKTFTVK